MPCSWQRRAREGRARQFGASARLPDRAAPRRLAEGVIVAKKDYNLAKHPDVEEVSNLEVIKLLTSLTSRDLVTCRFSWKHYYWFLTDAGIE